MSIEPYHLHLIAYRELEEVENSVIAKLINDCLRNLRPDNDTFCEKFLVFLIDAAPYMVNAEKSLTVCYPNFFHVTYLTHALHRVAEQIGKNSELVNKIIPYVKNIFLKVPMQVKI